MKKQSTVVCIGELLIDFYCTDIGTDLTEGKNFEKQAGGAPANVCATISKLGGKAAFSGKVGRDPFGIFLKNTLDQANVDTSMLMMDKKHTTTFAFVSLKSDGERDFVFNRGADAYLEEIDLDKDKLQSAKIMHFGSATALLNDPFRETYLNTMKLGKQNGQFISFDPNYRGDLWTTTGTFVNATKQALTYAHFAKMSEEELAILTETDDITSGLKTIHSLGVELIAVTLGYKGTLLSNGETLKTIPSIPVKSIDSTGAGDAFVGAMLYQLAETENPQSVITDFNKLKMIVSFSNKVGAIVCTKVGAISSLPTYDEVIAESS